MTVSRTTQNRPQSEDELPMSPRNRARTPFTTCFSGLMSDRCCSQAGPICIGSKMPDSSSSGMAMPLSSGASASSLLVMSATEYDSEAKVAPSSATITSDSSTPPHGARRPRGSAASSRRIDCTTRTTTSRSTRPAISAIREAGVTRSASMTPARSSAIRPKPTNIAPNMPSCTIRPGMNTW